jgi:hypothetical protein
MLMPHDINWTHVKVGTLVRLLSLSSQWLDDLPSEEKNDVLFMVGEVFAVEEIDQYGHPWVRNSWPNEAEGKCHSHSIVLEPNEMKVVTENAL